MKRLKKCVSFLMALSVVLALCVSAGATEFALIKSDSKSANVGTTATITGEVWGYTYVYNGIVWMEPTAKTIVNSSKTMAEVTANMECRYNDTGNLVNSNATAYNAAYNTNTVAANAAFSVQRTSVRVVIYTAHGATYSRSDVLYMTASA